MKSNIQLTIEFLAGTDIREAVTEAKQKAIDWNVAYVNFTFNSIKCSISQKCNEDKAVRSFYNCIEKMINN